MMVFDDTLHPEYADNTAGMRAADPSVPATELTEEEQILYLIHFMRDERVRRGALTNRIVPLDMDERRDYLRGLFNMRSPEVAGARFIEVQDAYLQRRLIDRGGPIDATEFPPFKGDAATGIDKQISLWQGDETLLKIGAIVNTARRDLLGCYLPGHHCIDNAIHTYAGVQLRHACNEIMIAQGHPEPMGSAKLTLAYNLPADYVIHTVAPILDNQDDPTKRQIQMLGDCYRSCLNLCAENNIDSISFCCVGTGVYGFPRERAAEIAVNAVRGWLEETGSNIHVVFDMFRDDDVQTYTKLLS